MVRTRRNRPHAGPVLRRLCTRSTPARRANRNGDCWEITPRPVPLIRRLAVDERGKAKVGLLVEKRGNQLARVRLRTAHLAGNEEDEVDSYVHAAPVSGC